MNSMKFLVFFLFLSGVLFSSASEEVLSIFKVDKKDFKWEDSSLKGANLLSQSVRGWIQKPTKSQSLWIDAVERGSYKSALAQWDRAFGKLSKTATGQAFFAHLLYKKGLKVTGIEALFNIKQPQKIHPLAITLWREYLSVHALEWDALYVDWNPAWKGIFPLGVEVHLQYLSLGNKLEVKNLKELLSRTQEKHPRRGLIEWKLFSALVLQGKSQDAAKLLKRLMVQNPSSVDKDIMLISAARVLFQNNYLSPALHYYAKVPKKSEYWIMAQEEMATSYLRKGEPQNSLALLMTLVHPHFAPLLNPEVYLLKALSELKICHYTLLQETLDQFKAHFQTKTVHLQNLVKNPRQAVTLRLFQKMKQKGSLSLAEMGPDVVKLPLYITKDKLLRRYLHIYQVSLQEMGKKDSFSIDSSRRLTIPEKTTKSTKVARSTKQSSLEQMKLNVELKTQKVDRALYTRVQKLAQEEIGRIHGILRKLHIIEADLLQNVYKVQAQSVSKFKDKKKTSLKKGSTVLVDKYKMLFSRAGEEQWLDELSYYNVDIKGACNK